MLMWSSSSGTARSPGMLGSALVSSTTSMPFGSLMPSSGILRTHLSLFAVGAADHVLVALVLEERAVQLRSEVRRRRIPDLLVGDRPRRPVRRSWPRALRNAAWRSATAPGRPAIQLDGLADAELSACRRICLATMPPMLCVMNANGRSPSPSLLKASVDLVAAVRERHRLLLPFRPCSGVAEGPKTHARQVRSQPIGDSSGACRPGQPSTSSRRRRRDRG